MKYFLCLFLGLSLIFGFQYNALSAETVKIGVVDVQKLQQKSKNFKKVREELKKKGGKIQVKLDKEKAELQKMEEELQKQLLMLSFDAKEDKRKELAKKKRKFKFLYDESLQEMKDAELEATRIVGKDIEKIVRKIGKEKNYTLILEKRATGLLYNQNSVDITDEVVAIYDKGM